MRCIRLEDDLLNDPVKICIAADADVLVEAFDMLLQQLEVRMGWEISLR